MQDVKAPSDLGSYSGGPEDTLVINLYVHHATNTHMKGRTETIK
jgi:hypothetical protein